MNATRRLAIFVAGLVALGYVLWPETPFDRDSEWRSVLAGFQLQRETGDFIGATRSLIHFHDLDGRAGHVRIDIAPRLPADLVDVTIRAPGGARYERLDAKTRTLRIPFARGTVDLEIDLEVTSASNGRPLRVSALSLHRDPDLRSLARALLPLIAGLIFATAVAQVSAAEITAFSILVIVGAAAFCAAAFDPARILALSSRTAENAPLVLAALFAILGLHGRDRLVAGIALFAITLSLHAHTVHQGFVYDDRLWSRPWTLGEIASTFAGSEDPLRISGDQYRPVPSVTHALDHALFGSSPWAFHFTNMTLHACSALLLFLLLERMKRPRSAALIGALAYAIHPLSASSIGWISERTDTLADIFILATLAIFVGPGGTKPSRVLPLALLALWSKETSVMLPALALLAGFVALDRAEMRARFATLRALAAFVVLYVAIWVSIFPEKTIGRLTAAAATLSSSHNGWLALFGSLFSQLFDPIGFETWRAARDTFPDVVWVAVVAGFSAAFLIASLTDPVRGGNWRAAFAGLAFSALAVLPFRGHDAVDIYRLGHTPAIGFGILVAGLASFVVSTSFTTASLVALLLVTRLAGVASETSAAWGYPGFQFRMNLRFNLENPNFVRALTQEMRNDLEFERAFIEHRDEPLSHAFPERPR